MGPFIIFGLPTEIAHDILIRVQLTDVRGFHSFRASSRDFKAIADEIFYRRIVLTDAKHFECRRRKFMEPVFWEQPQSQWNIWNLLVKETIVNLMNVDHRSCKIVHDLTIGPFEGSECYIDGEFLLRLLSNIERLRDFRWHLSYKIPTRIMDILQRKFPQCRFHVSQMDRLDDHLDELMLCFPTLTTLELAVVSDYRTRATEFAILNELLPRMKSLQYLSLHHIDIRSVYTEAYDVEQAQLRKNPPRLQGPGWLVTPLEHTRLKALTLGPRASFDRWPAQMHSWLVGIDWTSLTHLDIQNSHHPVVLRGLTNRAPCLRSLKLGGAKDIYPDGSPSPSDDCLSRFLSTTSMLTRVSIANQQWPTWAHYVNIVLQDTGHRLRSFVAEPGGRYAAWPTASWGLLDIEMLQNRAPNLRHLALDLDPLGYFPDDENLSRPSTHDCDTLFGMPSSTPLLGFEVLSLSNKPKLKSVPKILSGFSRLERVHLALELCYECASCDCLLSLNELGQDRLNTGRMTTILRDIFAASMTSKPRPALEFVEIVIRSRNDTRRIWRVYAHRNQSSSAEPISFSMTIDIEVRGRGKLLPSAVNG